MSDVPVPAELGQAHQRFIALVSEIRPELHRYCARMTGSITDGEDVVQETLAKAFYALSMSDELPPLRPWLFRVAHNASIDFTRKHDRKRVDLVGDAPEPAASHASSADEVDPDTVREALVAFLALPPLQRSVVISKDVLECSGAEIAEMLETTVPAVKAALVRGRDTLRRGREARLSNEEAEKKTQVADPETRALLERYVALFNTGDWDGLRALLTEDVRLDLVSKAARRGRGVSAYFGRYAAEPDIRVALGTLEGRPVLFAFTPKESLTPRYVIEVAWHDGRVAFLRDYRYVSYMTHELGLTPHAIER
jgi:RNA polymerase sigma-70 factor (ECF subfamily)